MKRLAEPPTSMTKYFLRSLSEQCRSSRFHSEPIIDVLGLLMQVANLEHSAEAQRIRIEPARFLPRIC